jgi:general secretion pathway protein H
MPSDRRGFTLLELVVVLAVVGLAAGILLPRLADLGPFELDAAARRLADALTLARERAVLRAAPAHLTLDLATGSWTTDEPGTAVSLPPRVRVRAVVANGERAVDTGIIVIRFDPAGDALPARVDLAHDGGAARNIVLPPAGARAVVGR